MLDDVIHAGVEATLTWLTTKDPGLKQLIDKSYGYAVFPAVGRAGVLLGIARGHGEVFERGKPIGFATLTQMTVGVQVGGQTFSELVLFDSKDTLEAFKKSKVSFTANASAVLVKAGGTGTSDYDKFIAKAYQRGGLLLEATIGGQKLKFGEHAGKGKKGKSSSGDGSGEVHRGHEARSEGSAEAEGVAGHARHAEGPHTAERAEDADRSEDAESADPTHAVGAASDETTAQPPPQEGDESGAGVATQAVGARTRISRSGRQLIGKAAHLLASHGRPRGPLNRLGLTLAAKRHPLLLGKPARLLDKIKAAATGLEKEATLGPVLGAEVNAALKRLEEHDPSLRDLLDKAYGYAVFPLVGKAAAALGVGYGRGEVFERGKLIGYAAIVQLTIGVQVGGETYDELVVFENAGALDRFKSGKVAFAANASAVIVKAGAAATTNYSSGTAVFVRPEGGLMIEIGLGGQKFIFRRKVLGSLGLKGQREERQPGFETNRPPPQLQAGRATSKHMGAERKNVGGQQATRRTS